MRHLKGATHFYCWAISMTDTPLGLVSAEYTNKADEYTAANATFNAKDKKLIFLPKCNICLFC